MERKGQTIDADHTKKGRDRAAEIGLWALKLKEPWPDDTRSDAVAIDPSIALELVSRLNLPRTPAVSHVEVIITLFLLRRDVTHENEAGISGVFVEMDRPVLNQENVGRVAVSAMPLKDVYQPFRSRPANRETQCPSVAEVAYRSIARHPWPDHRPTLVPPTLWFSISGRSR